MNTPNYILRKAVDWLLRRRSPALAIFKAGVYLIVLSIAGSLIFNLKYQDQGQSFSFLINTSDTGSIWVQYGAFILGAFLSCIGLIWECIRYQAEVRLNNRRRVIVIEQRGLRNTENTPLSSAVPDSFIGQRDPLTIDIRNKLVDGQVTQPEQALKRIVSSCESIEQRFTEFAREDVDIVYGGLLPVPFTFLTGMLLDDENKLTVFDWDREAEKWRLLDGDDDKDIFKINMPNDFDNTTEAAIALSVSYPADLPQIKEVFPSIPIIHMELTNVTSNNHWSSDKQAALSSQFLSTVKELTAKGVDKLHLIIAAPNSVVFRLGRSYDKRNLPDAVVYQYERSNKPAYPWGVRLPTHGIEEPKIVYRE